MCLKRKLYLAGVIVTIITIRKIHSWLVNNQKNCIWHGFVIFTAVFICIYFTKAIYVLCVIIYLHVHKNLPTNTRNLKSLLSRQDFSQQKHRKTSLKHIHKQQLPLNHYIYKYYRECSVCHSTGFEMQIVFLSSVHFIIHIKASAQTCACKRYKSDWRCRIRMDKMLILTN